MQVRRFGILHTWSETATLPAAKALTAKAWALSAMLGAWALLVAERARGTVAAVDRHAVLQVTPVWGTRLGRIAATLVVASGIAIAGMVPVAVVLVVVAQVPGWWWAGNLVLVLLAPTAIDLLSRLRFVRPGPPAAPSAPCGEVHLGASLTAWPAAHEHGTRLLKAFSEAVEATGRDTPLAVDIYPRDGLRDFYTGHGFRVINPHTGLMRRTWPENR